ncbi:tetratricopeptide repeat protein [Hyphomicrobium sp. LHD-15]|uniref:tetratricopeptide repeat protein n=1 Tax=Hyphomicrobium sp. LHD-15 TaxID=3072142 RepID=UPI00280F551A|nr:tetratricopeptide repeat protein [Hyphomicrobium sp. LHD-15]MDQ8699818.1 tetratricopeptide repeat protein [Hyphomicrobium sp. LHD-15]
MLHSDQDRWPTGQGAYAFAGSAGSRSDAIHELAREIEDTQRRQGETIAQIVERLRALDLQTSAERDAASASSKGQAGDEPWDAASAEALMQNYEADAARAASRPAARPVLSSGPANSSAHQDWLGPGFLDVTKRIKRTLADLKPGSTIRVIEERLELFQQHISSILDDVVRRSDLEALKLIETHINYLGDKLDELDRHVSRLDGIEADVHSVMDQVSDERIGKLLEYDSRFAHDLEALAMKAAEEMHSRLTQDDARAEADTKRHEELRALIESSIMNQRKAETEAATLMTGLSGRVNAQSDRYDELKGLLESAITEQRQNEQTAFGMLDTLQQAMVRILDRMDAIEQQQELQPRPWPAEQDQAAEAELFVPQDADRDTNADVSFENARAHAEVVAPENFHDYGSVEMASPPPLPSALSADPALDAPAAQDDDNSPVDRLRRDFVADARRAKMKAAANRAEAIADTSDITPRMIIESVRSPMAAPQPRPSAASGRLFGSSSKLLAGVLALIIAINGGILLINRKNASQTAAPTITIQPAASADPNAAHDAPPPGPRSALDMDENSFAEFVPAAPKAPEKEGAANGGAGLPLGYMDDVLDPPVVETLGETSPASTPGGVTIAKPAGSIPDDVVADIYQQQILASLSGKLGTAAAGHSPDALLPEKSGRIDAAFTPPDAAAEAGDRSARSSALDLPPATVGPLSLRLAAANGDASAEFEVAARLAEGKGTKQNFADALRWYQRSAAKGFAQAQYRLGTLYERGLGVSQDLGRARVWYSRAAEQGNVKSMHNLAVLAAGGDNGEPDYATALTWFSKAAEHGLADSQYNLGVLLENGLGVKVDRVAAYKWYALAAQNGDMDALARRDALKGALAAGDLKDGENQVAAFKAQPLIPLANDARAAGEDWKKRVNNDTNG